MWSDRTQRRRKEGKGKTEKGFPVDRGDGCDFTQASVSLNTVLKSKQCPSDLYMSTLEGMCMD